MGYINSFLNHKTTPLAFIPILFLLFSCTPAIDLPGIYLEPGYEGNSGSSSENQKRDVELKTVDIFLEGYEGKNEVEFSLQEGCNISLNGKIGGNNIEEVILKLSVMDRENLVKWHCFEFRHDEKSYLVEEKGGLSIEMALSEIKNLDYSGRIFVFNPGKYKVKVSLTVQYENFFTASCQKEFLITAS